MTTKRETDPTDWHGPCLLGLILLGVIAFALWPEPVHEPLARQGVFYVRPVNSAQAAIWYPPACVRPLEIRREELK